MIRTITRWIPAKVVILLISIAAMRSMTGFSGFFAVQATAQATTNFRAPLVYGYQADPMMTYYNGNYYLYVDDQLGYDRMRKSPSLAGLGSAASEVFYVGTGGIKPGVNCVYIFHWNSNWYQYCGNGSGGTLVLESATDDPSSAYSYVGELDTPAGYTGYAEWPFQVGSQIYMLFTNNATSTTLHSIWAAKFSDPVTRTGAWSPASTRIASLTPAGTSTSLTSALASTPRVPTARPNASSRLPSANGPMLVAMKTLQSDLPASNLGPTSTTGIALMLASTLLRPSAVPASM